MGVGNAIVEFRIIVWELSLHEFYGSVGGPVLSIWVINFGCCTQYGRVFGIKHWVTILASFRTDQLPCLGSINCDRR